jgi:hypothetical protein
MGKRQLIAHVEILMWQRINFWEGIEPSSYIASDIYNTPREIWANPKILEDLAKFGYIHPPPQKLPLMVILSPLNIVTADFYMCVKIGN